MTKQERITWDIRWRELEMQAEGKIILNIKKNGMIQIILAAVEAIAKIAEKRGCEFSQKGLTTKGLACEIKGPLTKLKAVRKVIKSKGKLILPTYLLFESHRFTAPSGLIDFIQNKLSEVGDFEFSYRNIETGRCQYFIRGIVWIKNPDNLDELKKLKNLHQELTQQLRSWSEAIPPRSVWLFTSEKTVPSSEQKKQIAA